MRYVVPSLVLLVLASGAHAGVEECPSLPSAAQIKWRYEKGSDFTLCHAVQQKSGAEVFVVDVGGSPEFWPDEGDRIGPGTVGGHSAIWYRDTRAGSLPLSRHALIILADKRSVHIWFDAKTSTEVDFALQVLRDIRFK
jgi:hypothetical protein